MNTTAPKLDSQDFAPNEANSGLHCLIMVARYHNIAADPEQIAHTFALDDSGMDALRIIKAARELGLKSRSAIVKYKRLSKLPLPAIL